MQPEVLFLSEHPENQQVVLGSTLSLSCGVRLRGLSEEEGGLTVPTVGWSFNNTSRISDVRQPFVCAKILISTSIVLKIFPL